MPLPIKKLYILFYLVVIPLATLAQDNNSESNKIENFTEASPADTVNYSADINNYEQSASTEPAAPVYRKRSIDPNINKKYTGEDFDYKEEKAEMNFAERFLAWIRKVLRAIFGDGDKNANPNQKPLDTLIGWKILSVIALLVIVYFIVRAILNKEGMWIFGRSSKSFVTEDLEAENIHVMDFPTLIEKTRKEGDYRLAIRYYYLWLLKRMSARQIIDWNWEKTNTDYYYEIKDNNLRSDFQYLSYVYDHSWYGEFPIDEKSFGKAENAFKKTLNTI